ncbi:hypothetical protein HYPSUDRAFT_42211 [Hypholoma sublateritium FD-334 SS-4]|uniref:F-box domain-containing protein n=1 Tax=Hypholoma sublateritium (strain FD-334 SS-4) TaxID=945553 RepID=A0A0D2MCW7_HYPSF|nr:hypothetical protein HYPSUDRAFT_42211 [Hypholoma sublateritium FD-334 SS-4]
MSVSPPFVLLPAELLEECFRPLTFQDTRSVVFVCRVFADVGRLLLYRKIVLRSDQRHVEHTISLLIRDPTLAVKITHATLITVPPLPLEGSPWIRPDFFAHSVNLRSLELQGFPFSRPDDQGIFNTVLRTRCLKLARFTYRPGVVRFPDSGFELAGLKCVTWQSSLELKLMPIMAASSSSLTNISFEGMVIHKTGQPYDFFLQHHFPNLLSLQLGSLIQTNIPLRTNTLITQFILRHNGIQHLSLGRQRSNDMFFQFDETLLALDSLSCLQSFEGFPENVAVLARREVASLYQITALSIFCQTALEDPLTEIWRMFEIVKTQNTPKKHLKVQHIRLHFDVHFTHRMPSNSTQLTHLRLMDAFADMCPLVTTLHGRLLPMGADAFQKMFQMYEHLTVISLPIQSFLLLPHTPLKFFEPVAATCRKLRCVVARKPPYTDLKYTIHTLVRGDQGVLVAVDVRTTRDISAELDALHMPSHIFYH